MLVLLAWLPMEFWWMTFVVFFLCFNFVNFSVINSVCNKAVSALATEALSSVSDQVWLEDCPASIISLVNADLVQ
jgi:hypothetical protein